MYTKFVEVHPFLNAPVAAKWMAWAAPNHAAFPLGVWCWLTPAL
jgi:hypothetical protein